MLLWGPVSFLRQIKGCGRAEKNTTVRVLLALPRFRRRPDEPSTITTTA